MARRYFGTDGIRGLANGDKLTPELAMKVGMAAGLKFVNGDHRNRVVIGKDTRRSGYMLENALTAGFTAVGMDVYLLGPMPTPAVAMLTRSLRADLGVMISASHNPYEDNGIKLFRADGYKLSDAVEADIERMMDEDLSSQLSKGRGIGRAHRDAGPAGGEASQTRYIEYAKRTLPKGMDLTGLRVVVDCANGAAYKVAPIALWELGAEVFSIGVEPDGFNINDGVGSTAPDALRAKVREHRADIGIALDGDADRVIIVDEKGEIVDGDQFMAVIAESWHSRGELKGGGLVATVMSNLGLERYLGGIGLGLERTQVGDRYVLEAMRAKGYNVGGEQSGHIILTDFTTTGDGLIAALQLLAVAKLANKPISEICRRFEKVPQLLQSVRYKDGKPLEHKLVLQVISESRARLGDSGRLVIRESGTEPVIRVMAESDDESLVAAIVSEITATIKKVA
jgi:phosphoglucosamine mutase